MAPELAPLAISNPLNSRFHNDLRNLAPGLQYSCDCQRWRPRGFDSLALPPPISVRHLDTMTSAETSASPWGRQAGGRERLRVPLGAVDRTGDRGPPPALRGLFPCCPPATPADPIEATSPRRFGTGGAHGTRKALSSTGQWRWRWHACAPNMNPCPIAMQIGLRGSRLRQPARGATSFTRFSAINGHDFGGRHTTAAVIRAVETSSCPLSVLGVAHVCLGDRSPDRFLGVLRGFGAVRWIGQCPVRGTAGTVRLRGCAISPRGLRRTRSRRGARSRR